MAKKNHPAIMAPAPMPDAPSAPPEPKIPTGTIEMVGSAAAYTSGVTPMSAFNKGIRGGQMQMTGTVDNFHAEPERGWRSYPAPVGREADSKE